jgi:rhamnosyltransferase
MQEDCAAVIVTFHPSPEDIQGITSISEKVGKVYVIDNTPAGKRPGFLHRGNIHWQGGEENIGLSAGLNIGMDLGILDGFEKIFLFDQDSRPSASYVDNMLNFKMRIDRVYPGSALVVPNFFDKNSRTYAKFPVIGRFRFSHRVCNGNSLIIPKDALIAITSGSLISAEYYKAIGPFREDYFIDFIDNEYCLRAHRKGYRVVVNCEETLIHSIGKRSTEKWLGLTIKPNRHAALRRYFIARNGIRTAVEYGTTYPSFSVLILLRLIHEFLSILIFEDHKKAKGRAILLGFYDGLLKKKRSVDILLSIL